MRPVLFAVFVIFAVCVSAANLPVKRPKRATPAVIGQVVQETTAIGVIGDKLNRLSKIRQKIGLVITIIQIGYDILSTINMNSILDELKKNQYEIQHSFDDGVNVKSVSNFVGRVSLLNNPLAYGLGLIFAQYAEQKLKKPTIQKQEVNEENKKLNPEVKKLFDDIEALANDIQMKKERHPSIAKEVAEKLKAEGSNMLSDTNNYVEQLNNKNVGLLRDEEMKQFLIGIRENLKKISSDVDKCT